MSSFDIFISQCTLIRWDIAKRELYIAQNQWIIITSMVYMLYVKAMQIILSLHVSRDIYEAKAFHNEAKAFHNEAKAFHNEAKAFHNEAKAFHNEAKAFHNEAKAFKAAAKAFHNEAFSLVVNLHGRSRSFVYMCAISLVI
ncbi:hypothetical protein KP509_05G088100 [Ceratopteris richardii]|uniref:Uncharacterized protein n=1 Tax=Ceratopteris richardii TaxID=49495 RepID=A0A8T2UR03_CERRI|nr:hypothetical protein KP509_05G088100 [Ceratopteris richardii]